MSEVAYCRWGEGKSSKKDVDTSALGDRIRRRLMFDAVLMYEANRRVGTASTKGRGEVAGTSKKPFKQKHTGRARVGTLQSPTRRGGGAWGAPKPRDFSYSMPKKARRLALSSALLSKVRDGELVLVDKFGVAAPKTKEMARFLDGLGLDGSKLLVMKETDEKVLLSARNIRGVAVRSQADLNAYDVLRYRNVIVTEDAFASLTERLSHAAD